MSTPAEAGGARRFLSERTAASSRGRAAAELAAFLLLLEGVLWSDALPSALTLRLAAGAGLATVVLASMLRRGGFAGAAIGRGSALPAWVLAVAVTALGCLSVAASAWGLGWSSPPFAFSISAWGSASWWIGKAVAVTTQQLLLHWFVFPLCLELTRRRLPALALAALLFGAAHLPNPALSILTAVAAPVWCALFLRNRRLLPLIASHVVLAIFARAVCGDAIYAMRVGAAVMPLLPRNVVADDGSELRVTPRSLEGFLEACYFEAGRLQADPLAAEPVECSGWCADVGRATPCEAIMVLAGGSWHRYRLTGQPRPDVAESYGSPSLLLSGFRVPLPLEWLEEPGSRDSLEQSRRLDAVRFFGVSGDLASEFGYMPDVLSAPFRSGASGRAR